MENTKLFILIDTEWRFILPDFMKVSRLSATISENEAFSH